MMIFEENEYYQHQHPQEWVNFLLLQPWHPHHVNTTDFSQDYFWPGIFTIHSMFIYRWSSNFVETLSWKESNGGRDAVSCLLPCVLYCMEGEFEQVISKIRLSKGQQQLTAE